MIDRLSQGDITKHVNVVELEYLYCLQQLLFWKLQDEYNDEMNRIQQKLNKRK